MSEISLKTSEISLKTSENTATPFSEWQYFHSSHSKKFREYVPRESKLACFSFSYSISITEKLKSSRLVTGKILMENKSGHNDLVSNTNVWEFHQINSARS